MILVLRTTWPLLLGMMLLMVGNGLQGTLLPIRGAAEGFSIFELSLVTSAYFVGFLGGSRMAPKLIQRVGHVRVFAALASLISAVMVLYPLMTLPAAWILGRLLIGFCFSGVYVTAESWLNDSVDNAIRGQALSLYMIVQMAGIVASQGLYGVASEEGFELFVISSILVSIAFAPILLSVSPTPAFDTAKPMALRELWDVSPLGCTGMAVMGLIFSALFGMASVYGTQSQLSVAEISTFFAAIYLGGLVLQYPIGWMSDRMDRRILIMAVSAGIAFFCLIPLLSAINFPTLLGIGFMIGGLSNPLYALLIAYTNDFLEHEDMAAASGGLIFINGLGAITGPIIAGWMMQTTGPNGFFLFLMVAGLALVVYAGYRMTQRAAPAIEDTGSYAPLTAASTPVAVEVAQEYFIDTALEEEEAVPDSAAG